ncbi:hypothetical protein L873DRAFT_1830186 [Choiromyces venosus 120613-1]|uniref:GH16 domain-containing protein n=1 Tax=Choiromyces venosus 120613-1 TaxID=1336337 RepID=A0A3N4JBL0_9PEZI|nr:hypothetical protein L873DRAFT_1830186 [Choiromyces venosus 120613-1]
MKGIAILSIIGAPLSHVAYTVLQENYTPENFFSKFDFFTGANPTNGFVKYNTGPIRTNTGSVYVGVDYTNSTPNSRPSVRLESNAHFTRGLFVLDLVHTPSTQPTTHSWTFGDNWPNQGEIDIIEGVHTNTQNMMALHTSDGCTGCSAQDTRTNSYGTGFNNIGVGVYAMEWNSQFIKVWYFPRGSIPADALAGNPDYSIPGSIMFDTTFCGDWAGGVWGD